MFASCRAVRVPFRMRSLSVGPQHHISHGVPACYVCVVIVAAALHFFFAEVLLYKILKRTRLVPRLAGMVA